MQTDLALILQSQFDSLRSIRGFEAYKKFIQKRKDEKEISAEIKALYEINKKGHVLTEICSHESSQPEGKFDMQGTQGIIEVANINYLFDSGSENRKLINRISKFFIPLQKNLSGKYFNYAIKCVIFSFHKTPSDEDLAEVKSKVLNIIRVNDNDGLFLFPWGIIGFFEKGSFPYMDGIINADLILVFKNTGNAIAGKNIDISNKILRKIHKKKRQHRDYANSLRVFYFCIDAPPTKVINSFNETLIEEKLSENDIVVICSTWGEAGKNFEYKKVFGNKKSFFDFTNIHYSRHDESELMKKLIDS